MNDLFASTQTVTAYRLSWKFIQRANCNWPTGYLDVLLARSKKERQDLKAKQYGLGIVKASRTHVWVDINHPDINLFIGLARDYAHPATFEREQGLVTPADMTIGRAAELSFQRPETLTVEVTQ